LWCWFLSGGNKKHILLGGSTTGKAVVKNIKKTVWSFGAGKFIEL
jgi:hypothetical protein